MQTLFAARFSDHGRGNRSAGGKTPPCASTTTARVFPMTIRPDPTFHASPKLAMEAPRENFAYTLLLSPDFSKHH
jgi:hypothetical protein